MMPATRLVAKKEPVTPQMNATNGVVLLQDLVLMDTGSVASVRVFWYSGALEKSLTNLTSYYIV